MADDTIRYGIIGTGMMGCEHIRNILHIEGARVAALADPHEESRRWGLLACGDRAAEVATYGSHRELLHSAEVDVVVVATPNHTHIDVLEDVLAGPLPVLVEKPLCTTLADCRRVIELADAREALVWVGLEYRYIAPVAAFLAALEAGAVGALRMISIREHRHPFLPKVGHWNRFNRNTGGTLVEKCCHFFDLMNLAIGTAPVRVYASGGQDVNHLDERYAGERPDILDNAFVIVDYEGGARACLDLCMFAESSRNEQELVATGDGGKLECSVPEGELVVGTRRHKEWHCSTVPPDPRVAHAGFHHGASYLEHLELLRAIRSGGPPAVDVRDGLRSVALGVAAHRSIQERRAVSLEELGPWP